MFGKRTTSEPVFQGSPAARAAQPAPEAPPRIGAVETKPANVQVQQAPKTSAPARVMTDTRSEDYYQIKSTIFNALIDTIDLFTSSGELVWSKVLDTPNGPWDHGEAGVAYLSEDASTLVVGDSANGHVYIFKGTLTPTATPTPAPKASGTPPAPVSAKPAGPPPLLAAIILLVALATISSAFFMRRRRRWPFGGSPSTP